MAKRNGKALAKTEAAPMVPDAPEWLKQKDAPQGMENMRPEDVIIPRVLLMQALSPQVVEGDRRPGELVNSLTGEVLAEDGENVRFIPIFHFLEWIKWGDRDKKEGMLDRSLDIDGPLAVSAGRRELNEKGRPIVTEYHNFIALFAGISMIQPVMIGCSKTNHKKGKQLITLSKYRGKFDLFAGAYTIGTKDEQNRAGQTYKVYAFENAGWSTKDEYAVAQKFCEGFIVVHAARRLKIDDDTNNDHSAANPANETEI